MCIRCFWMWTFRSTQNSPCLSTFTFVYFLLSWFIDSQAFWLLLSVLPLVLNHAGLIFFNGAICFRDEMVVQAPEDPGPLLHWEMKGKFLNPQVIMISTWEMNAFTFWFPGAFYICIHFTVLQVMYYEYLLMIIHKHCWIVMNSTVFPPVRHT